MVFLHVSFFVTLAKSPGTVGSQRILKPSQKKVSRHIAPSYLKGGGGLIERVIRVSTCCRLLLSTFIAQWKY